MIQLVLDLPKSKATSAIFVLVFVAYGIAVVSSLNVSIIPNIFFQFFFTVSGWHNEARAGNETLPLVKWNEVFDPGPRTHIKFDRDHGVHQEMRLRPAAVCGRRGRERSATAGRVRSGRGGSSVWPARTRMRPIRPASCCSLPPGPGGSDFLCERGWVLI